MSKLNESAIADMNQRVFQIEADINDVDHEIRNCHAGIAELEVIRREAERVSDFYEMRMAELSAEELGDNLRRLSATKHGMADVMAELRRLRDLNL